MLVEVSWSRYDGTGAGSAHSDSLLSSGVMFVLAGALSASISAIACLNTSLKSSLVFRFGVGSRGGC